MYAALTPSATAVVYSSDRDGQWRVVLDRHYRFCSLCSSARQHRPNATKEAGSGVGPTPPGSGSGANQNPQGHDAGVCRRSRRDIGPVPSSSRTRNRKPVVLDDARCCKSARHRADGSHGSRTLKRYPRLMRPDFLNAILHEAFAGHVPRRSTCPPH